MYTYLSKGKTSPLIKSINIRVQRHVKSQINLKTVLLGLLQYLAAVLIELVLAPQQEGFLSTMHQRSLLFTRISLLFFKLVHNTKRVAFTNMSKIYVDERHKAVRCWVVWMNKNTNLGAIVHLWKRISFVLLSFCSGSGPPSHINFHQRLHHKGVWNQKLKGTLVTTEEVNY
jgi:hypothetical protein